MSKKKVLITGINGLLGTAFKDHFLQKEYSEFSFVFADRSVCDLTDGKDVDYMFWSYRPEMVIHCAARVGGIGRNISSPAQQFTDNILMNTHVIDQARKHNVKKLIAFSSVCAFPGDAKILKEDNLHAGPPFPAHWSYAMAKRMVDVQIESYRKQYEVDYCSVIPSNIFGENDNYNLEDGHIVPSIIHKFYKSILTKTNVECWGTGEPLREFVYARDLAKVCLELLKKDEPLPQRLIVPGQEFSIKKIVEKINIVFLSEFNFPSYFWPNIIWNKEKPNGQMRRKSESQYFNKLFPNFQYTNIDNALKKSINWFIMNYANVRK